MKNASYSPIEGKGLEAAKMLLERKGLEVLEGKADWLRMGLVAVDGDVLVFVQVRVAEGIMPERDVDARALELAAAMWLAENGESMADCRVRFDDVAIAAYGDAGKALARHTINALA